MRRVRRAREFSDTRNPKPKIGRNDYCPCASGEKAKHCHMQGSTWRVELDVLGEGAPLAVLERDMALAYLTSTPDQKRRWEELMVQRWAEHQRAEEKAQADAEADIAKVINAGKRITL